MILDDKFLDLVETYGPPARSLSMCLRPTFCAEDENHTMLWGDWSSIEARKLPWLADSAGAHKVLDVFRSVDADPNAADIYMREAGHIHGIDPNEINARIKDGDKIAKGWRQEGKVAVLALGFGGGVGALMAMAAGYGLFFTDEEAQRIVDVWRGSNRWAKKFWDALNEAFISAYENPGVEYHAGRLIYIHDKDYHGGTTFCIMPCGRILTYPNLKWREVERENRQGEAYTQKVITYRKGYTWGSVWHGILAENPTQGSCASILRAKLRHIERDILAGTHEGFVTRGHTHDEIIGHCHNDELEGAKAYLKRVMDEPLEWTDGLPLVSEITSNWSYSKAVE